MSKGEDTKERIVEQTAPIFNKLGFSGASLADVMKATGLQKGGIYNHFSSKDELALEAFEHAAKCVSERIAKRLDGKAGAAERLLAFTEVFFENYMDPPVEGGCPVLNTAIESDDAHPLLRARAQAALDRWRKRITTVVEEGQASGELRADLEPDVVATNIISTLEGGTMMSRLYGDPTHIRRAVDMTAAYVRRDLTA